MTKHQIKGHCLCGAVQIALIEPKQHVEVCQCNMCRRWSGSLFAGVSGESYTVNGEDAVETYRSSDWAERAFCRKCGSNLWFTFLPTGHRGFLAGLFDGASAYPLEREIFADQQTGWSKLPGDHPRLTGEEVIAEAKEAGFEFD